MCARRRGGGPFWPDEPEVVANAARRSVTGRVATTAEVVAASVFLLENGAVNGVDLRIDGGPREHWPRLAVRRHGCLYTASHDRADHR